MFSESRLYKATYARVGDKEIAPVQKLDREGHSGLAESKGVTIFLAYVRGLEEQLGIEIEE